jgi:hypothetical protein
MFTAAALMLEQGLTIEEVDALTGQAIGWPRTGTFRLADWWASTFWPMWPRTFPQGVTQGGFSGCFGRDCEARLAGRQGRPGLLQEGSRCGRKRSGWCSIWPASSTVRRPSPRCPLWRWPRTPPRCRSGCGCCWPTIRPKTRRRPFCGRFWPRCGTLPPTASAKWPATRPPSTAPCAPASTGSWARLRCGMRRESPRPSPA